MATGAKLPKTGIQLINSSDTIDVADINAISNSHEKWINLLSKYPEIYRLPAGTDYNTIVTAGVYLVMSTSVTHAKNSPFNPLESNIVIVNRHPEMATWSQFAIGLGSDKIATRRIVGDTDFSRPWVTYVNDIDIQNSTSTNVWGNENVMTLGEIGTPNMFNTGMVVNELSRTATISVRTVLSRISSDDNRNVTLLTLNNYKPILNVQGETLISNKLYALQSNGNLLVYGLAVGDNDIRLRFTYQF